MNRTPDDLAREYADAYPLHNAPDEFYTLAPAAVRLIVHDAFRAGYAAAVGRAADVADECHRQYASERDRYGGGIMAVISAAKATASEAILAELRRLAG